MEEDLAPSEADGEEPELDLEEPEPDVVEPEPAVDAPELKVADGALSETTPVEAATDTEPRLDLEPAPFPASTDSLRLFVESEPAALGPLSIGSPDGGLLFNPVAMPEGALWKVRNPRETFATAETIEFITSAIEAVEARHPGSPRLVIGDISRPDGGRLNRHRSHQAGRDADIGFYFRSGEVADFKRPGRDELDVPRTWTFVRALVTDTDVERIFVDRACSSCSTRTPSPKAKTASGWTTSSAGAPPARTPSSSTSGVTRTTCTLASTTALPRSAGAWPIPCSCRPGSCPGPPSPTACARARPCPTCRGGTGPA